MAQTSPQSDLKLVVQGSRNTTTGTPDMRNGPGLKQEENTQGQDICEGSISLIEDRARPIKQEQNTQGEDIRADSMNFVEDRQLPFKKEENHQPKEIHAPQDAISPE